MLEEMMVSICCITYNHGKYIRYALEGFLKQKTDFKYEILIHDDASTDDTVRIIKEYVEKYPDIIKPMYQKENQFSQRNNVTAFNSCRATGKYIALCEGDDFWIDPLKLKKQVDYMQAHPECSLCVHAAYRVNGENKKLRYKVRPRNRNGFFKVEDTIYGGGGLFATNSMMYPRALNENFPPFYEISSKVGVEDYPLTIYLSLKGRVYYMNELMSAYRIGIPGSWSTVNYATCEKQRIITDFMFKMLNELDKDTEYNYDNIIQKTKHSIEIDMLLSHKKFKELLKLDYYKTLDLNNKCKYILCRYFPWLKNFIIFLRYS